MLEITDQGYYACLAINYVGNVSSAATFVAVHGPPLSLTGLVVTEITHNSAKLQWDSVVSTDVVHKFELAVFDLVSLNFNNISIPRVAISTTNGMQEYSLEQLSAYTPYRVLIRATNVNGNSEFREFSEFRSKVWYPTSPPTVHTRNVTPFTIDIHIITNAHTLNGPYRGVRLIISSDKFTNETFFNSTSQLKISTTKYDLYPYSQYTITAFSFNGAFYSDPSTELTVRTLESYPASPPEDLNVNCTSPSACLLHWQPPSEPNGLITVYSLTIENLQRSGSHIKSFPVFNQSYYLAENLTPHSRYSWEILASTKEGPGPSATYEFQTPQGVPGASPPLHVRVVNATAIILSWSPIKKAQLNGLFHHYQILYTYMSERGEMENSTLIVNGSEEVVLTSLTPYTNYAFSIRVNAGVGYGPFSPNPTHRLTASAVPEEVVGNITAISFTPNSIYLEWKRIPRALVYAPTAGYRIQTFQNAEWADLVEITYPTNRYYINDLLPNTVYKFRIQLFNFLGSASYSNATSVTTQQTIPSVPLVSGSIDITGLIISLDITPQDSTTGDILEYKVQVNELGERVHTLLTLPPLSIHGTTRLTYNATKFYTYYKFTISAKTSVGFGESAVFLIESGQTAPSRAPRGLTAVPQTPTSIHLSWKPIPIRYLNGFLTGYLVRYSSAQHPEWMYTNLTHSFYQIVTGLERYTSYTFQVVGVTVANGPYSDPVSNRTLPDTPGVIESVFLIRVEADLLQIGWDPPADKNGVISQYRIHVIQLNINDLAVHASTLNSITLRDLHPFTRYRILVAATNQVATGQFSEESVFMTLEDTPSKPYIARVDGRGRRLVVKWYSPYDPNGLILDYNLTCSLLSPDDTQSPERKITVLHEPGIFYYTASCLNLLPNNFYSIRVSARNSFNSSWTSVVERTDYLPPTLADSTDTRPEVVSAEERIFSLPKFSKTVGTISFYLLIVLVFDPLTESVDSLSTNQTIYSLLKYALTSETTKPQNYIAANFTPSEYGEFTLGDNQLYGGYRNIPLKEGFGYAFYVKGCVNSIYPHRFLATSSTLSEPIILSEGADSNSSIGVISVIVAISTIFLLLLICVLIILVSIFCARLRAKRNGVNSRASKRLIPYQPCDTDLNSVPWSANVNIKKLPKGTDPISYYRSVINDPQLDARAPVPAFMLPKILEALTADGDIRLSEEYSYLSPIETSTTIVATSEINSKKNRYLNILPYDHNRVILPTDSKNDSDYINASFIDSADKKNAYIATQGPTESTLEDFWEMVYDQHVLSLVMITKLKERGVDKCIQYWPTKDTNVFGHFKVTLMSTTVYCDYTVRKLLLGKITANKESRILYHFQFLSWPDHGVPPHPFPMLNFLKRVHQTMHSKRINTTHPILVHCSAGVGRTGTFIVLDSMLKRMLSDKDVDVFGHVAYLRTQRMFMVQGEDQYLFIYKVLTECYTSQKTDIPLNYMDHVFSNLAMVSPNTQQTGFELEFNLLDLTCNEDELSTASNAANAKKNRYTRIVPFDCSRVVLHPQNELPDTDYINASFIDSISCKQQFIATQTPLANTIPDFWRMIWQYKSPIIVMLTSHSSDFDQCYYPEKQQIYDKFQVEKTSERCNRDNYLYQQFSIMNLNTGEVRNVSHFLYSPLSELNRSVSAKSLLLLCQEISNMYQSSVSVGLGPITVHCSNGSGDTGMLVAAMNLLEELREAKHINIFQTVQYLRSQRPYMVQTVEQYQMIYEAVMLHAKSVGKSSRKASGVEEYTPPSSPVKMSTFSKNRESGASWNSLHNQPSFTNNYRNSQISVASAFSNHECVLEISS